MDVADRKLYTSSDGSDAVVLSDNTEHFLDNNTISGIQAETSAYSDVSRFSRINDSVNFTLASVEVERDLGSNAPASGLDARGAGFSFTIKSNTTPIYPGVFFGKSGGSPQSAGVENTVGMSVYSGPSDSPAYAEIPVVSANRNACNIAVPVVFPSYTTTERNALVNVVNGMVIYNTTDSKMQAYAGGSWVDLH